jgi:signal transduction histidine kinase
MIVGINKYKKSIRQLEEELKDSQLAISELEVLNEIAMAAGKTGDIDQTLKLILNKTIKFVDAEHGVILLVSDNNEILETFIKQAKNSKVNKRPRIGEHITGWVLLNKKSLIIKDLCKESRFKTTEEERENIKSLICSPIWFEGKIIGILQMINKKTDQDNLTSFTDNDLTLLSIISVQAGQLIKNSELQELNFEKKREAENSRLRAEKAELQAKKIEAEKEISEQKIRTRIASDLHDEIASNLSSISMFSKIVQEEIEKNLPTDWQNIEAVSQFLERISTISRESINSIRDIIWAIDSKPETIYDLILKLRDTYVSIFLAKGITFNFDIPLKEKLPLINLSPEQRRNLWFILKEALNNAVKHSSCRELSLFLQAEEKDTINVEIKDDGKGFDTSSNHKGKGIGIMKKRAENIGADFEITSCKDKGSILKLHLKI